MRSDPARLTVTPVLLAGMIIACQVKEIQISTELRNMAEMGLIPRVTITSPGLPAYLMTNVLGHRGRPHQAEV